ncbi:WD40 repeat domain-containing protein [Robertmurraya korlensis]|uniref:YncE family protein n=1 Tax=Robertmurraya korlensis TaxID=519977 RepID=UPI00203DEACB|nr:WD40 repeat domain-containing protein [Robertmurraya korlensis]MCM3599930.1 WD40 repeat domain-containing protein [Robertmurraya korlensis]
MKVNKVMLITIWALLFIISGCSNDQPVIPENKSLAITVNIKDMSLSFVDLEEAIVIETWTMDKPYTGGVLLPDNDSLLLYGKQVETVDIYSLRTGKLINSWETGRGIVEGVLLSDREEIALSDQERQSVRFFRFDGKPIKEVVKTGNPLALIPTNSQLYVVSYNSKKLTTVDLQSKEITSQFSIHSAATGAIIQEDKNEIWIGGHGLGSELESYIHVYNSKTGELKRKISAPIMPINLLHNNDGTFALSHGSNSLYKISDEGVIQAKITVGANPFEITEYKDQLLVAGYDSNDIHFITEKDLSIGKSVKVGKGPFQIIIREID